MAATIDITQRIGSANNGWRLTFEAHGLKDTETLQAGDLSAIIIEETQQGERLFILEALRYTADPRAYWSRTRLDDEPMKLAVAKRRAAAYVKKG